MTIRLMEEYTFPILGTAKRIRRLKEGESVDISYGLKREMKDEYDEYGDGGHEVWGSNDSRITAKGEDSIAFTSNYSTVVPFEQTRTTFPHAVPNELTGEEINRFNAENHIKVVGIPINRTARLHWEPTLPSQARR